MRIHLNLKKALAIVEVIENQMQLLGLHVHGLSGDDLKQITSSALQKGHDIETAVKEFGLELKAAKESPEVL